MASKSSAKLAFFTLLLLFFAMVGWCGKVEVEEGILEEGLIEFLRSKLGPPACRFFDCQVHSQCRSRGCAKCNHIARKCKMS